LLIYHENIKSKKEYIYAKWKVLEKRNNRLQDLWREFKDKGNDFITKESNVENDLDIFGDNSLYQYLCTANTFEGRKILASYLQNDKFDKENIYKRQKAVKELIEKEELSIEIETLSMKIALNNKRDAKEWYDTFLKYIHMKKRIISPIISIGAIILTGLMIVLIVLQISGYNVMNIIEILGGVQLICAYSVGRKYKKIINDVYNFCLNIDGYSDLLNCISNADFQSDYLKSLCKKLRGKNKTVIGIKKLNNVNAAFSFQTNPYIHILLQLFLLYDIHCVSSLEHWKRKYGENMTDLFGIIGEVEALLSMSVIADNRLVSFPELVDNSNVILEANQITHPLISIKDVVPNPFSSKKGISIITGSNMSGKTTFLRTVGINAVLAYAGAPVCAERLRISFMRIFTSMRVQDDVSKGISSFYAEVLRIKEVVENLEKKKPMLVLIDEIFKGTNSTDRIVGAKEIIKTLNKDFVITLVSTHDFELCSLVEQREITGFNYHFEEYYRNDNIYFDYKIKDGKCKTKNAVHILKLAGLMIDN
ncbi:MutS-related protein, partial [Anaerosporobacter sp.]